VAHPSLASEFPNDNAEISGGAIWICAELTGPATAELTPYEPVRAEPFVLFFDDEDEDDGAVDGPVDLHFSRGELTVSVLDATPEPSAAPSLRTTPEVEPMGKPEEPETAPESSHQHAQAAAVETAPESSHQHAQAAAVETAPAFAHFESALVAALMAQGASRSAALVPRLLRLEALPPEALAKDVQLTLQSRGYLDGNARYSPKYRELCGAWSAVLHGSSQDFAACGTTTLDRFGADLLAALLAVPATRADELRRMLRKSGIAAFGVLEAA
jgi:hypothetical protein